MSDSQPKITEAQVKGLYIRGIIDHATRSDVLPLIRGESTGGLGQRARVTCRLAIAEIVEASINAACKTIQDRLGVKTGDLAAATLLDGTIERELTRYVHAELELAGLGDVP